MKKVLMLASYNRPRSLLYQQAFMEEHGIKFDDKIAVTSSKGSNKYIYPKGWSCWHRQKHKGEGPNAGLSHCLMFNLAFEKHAHPALYVLVGDEYMLLQQDLEILYAHMFAHPACGMAMPPIYQQTNHFGAGVEEKQLAEYIGAWISVIKATTIIATRGTMIERIGYADPSMVCGADWEYSIRAMCDGWDLHMVRTGRLHTLHSCTIGGLGMTTHAKERLKYMRQAAKLIDARYPFIKKSARGSRLIRRTFRDGTKDEWRAIAEKATAHARRWPSSVEREEMEKIQ